MRNLGYVLGKDISMYRKLLAAADSHHNLLERGVAGTLADTVDSNLYLTGAVHHTGQSIGGSHAEVVVAVGRNNSLVYVGHIVHQIGDLGAILCGKAVAGGVRDIDNGGSCGNYSLHDPGEIFILGAPGILGVELYVVDIFAGILHTCNSTLEDVLAVGVEFIFNMVVGSADAGVDALELGEVQSLGGSIDVLLDSPRQGANAGRSDDLGDFDHALEVTGA